MRLQFSGILIIISLAVACQKAEMQELTQDSSSPGNGSSGNNGTGVTAGRLSYNDTLFYNHNLSSDKIANVITAPANTARYKAIPGGLSIDSLTGRINISKSESGIRYKVFAFNSSGQALDSVKIVISGVDYADEIFEIARTPNTYDTSFPIYNARPGLALPCSEDDDDDDMGCEFDETDLNDDGNDDIAGVIQDKLLVNKKTGTIDLEASFHAGIFGSSNPANGTSKDFLMYYRINDASGKALQKINIRVYYYNRKSDIPQLLLNELAIRNNQQQNVNARFAYTAEFSTYEKPKRPPILIIVGRL